MGCKNSKNEVTSLLSFVLTVIFQELQNSRPGEGSGHLTSATVRGAKLLSQLGTSGFKPFTFSQSPPEQVTRTKALSWGRHEGKQHPFHLDSLLRAVQIMQSLQFSLASASAERAWSAVSGYNVNIFIYSLQFEVATVQNLESIYILPGMAVFGVH